MEGEGGRLGNITRMRVRRIASHIIGSGESRVGAYSNIWKLSMRIQLLQREYSVCVCGGGGYV